MFHYVIHIKQHREHVCTLDFFALKPSCLKMQEYTLFSKLILYYRHAQLHVSKQNQEAGPKT